MIGVRTFPLALSLVILSTSANASDLDQFVGKYRLRSDSKIVGVLAKKVIRARMTQDPKNEVKGYDYYYFKNRLDAEYPVLNIYIDRAAKKVQVCDAINRPSVDPNSTDPEALVVYNRACQTESLPVKHYKYSERVMLLPYGAALTPSKDGKSLKIEIRDVLQGGLFPKPTKIQEIFDRIVQ